VANNKIPLMEMFGPTIQGEGALCGQVTYFIRTGGCPYRCSWCDTLEAVIPSRIKKKATYLTLKEIGDKFSDLSESAPRNTWVTLSGGDPLMWDLENLVIRLTTAMGLKVNVETQGSFVPEWLHYVDQITCSPKPPSSGMSDKIKTKVIDQYEDLGTLALKVAVFDDRDFEFARHIHASYPKVPFYMSAGTPPQDQVTDDRRLKESILSRYKWLVEKQTSNLDMYNTTVSPQMHALIWGREKGR